MFQRDCIQPVATITELLAEVKKYQDPDSRGLTFYAGAQRQASLSYSQYLGRINEWAAFLQAQGVKRGDRLATLLKNRLEVPVIYLAAMSIGAVVVPLNPSYSSSEMAFVLNDSRPVGVITDITTSTARLDELQGGRFVFKIEDIDLPAGAAPHVVEVVGDDPAITLYTSGTTSFPKGVVQMHRNLVANAWSMVKAFGINKPVQYSVMPFYHAHAVGFGMMSCLLSGGHLIVTERMDPFAWPQVINSEGVTLTSMVPNMLHLLVRTRVRRDLVPSLQFIFVSAAPLPTALLEQFERQSGIKIAHAWGLSEYTNFATALPAGLPDSLREPLLYGHETPCLGYALDGAQVEVRRNDDSKASERELGELCVTGPSLTQGYHGNADATRSAIREGWLYSGDEGYYITIEGRDYFFITDRIKDLIIRSGEKVSPAAIEATILHGAPHLANQIVVVGYKQEVYGEEIGLVVNVDETVNELDKALLPIIQSLPVRMRPKVILWGVDLVPRTHTGKIQRRLLKPRFASYEKQASSMIVERVA